MQTATKEYESAIVGGRRRIRPLALVDIVDPDIVYGAVNSNGETIYSIPKLIYNKQFSPERPYGTLEPNRFVLDGQTKLLPDNPDKLDGENGYIIGIRSKDDGTFSPIPFVELNLSNLSILQAASIHFTGLDYDGVGVDFTFDIYSGDTVVFHRDIIGNTAAGVYFDGFTIHNITKIRAAISKWSLPRRFARVAELVPGIYEKWGGGELYRIDVVQETALDCLTTPYGTCTLESLNQGKRFNPFNKSGLFKSIEARQGIPVSYGVDIPDGKTEYLPLGVFYQQSGGWETDAYGLTIKFRLVDIVGMIANRDFNVSTPLPTTLEAWITAIVAHLGENFKGLYMIDSSISGAAVTVNGANDLKNLKCGQILRYACMAAGAFFRADAATGKLRVEPLTAGGGITMQLSNMSSYPQNQAGDDIAQIKFRLADGSHTEHTVTGTKQTADKSISISNPFIHTVAEADAAAVRIMKFYGVTKYTLSGRGDMRSELGDIDTFETGFGDVATGRRYKQQLRIEDGKMKTAPSYLLGFEEATE